MSEIYVATNNPEQYASFSSFLRQNNVRSVQLVTSSFDKSGKLEGDIKRTLDLAQLEHTNILPLRRRIITGDDDGSNYVIGAITDETISIYRSHTAGLGYASPLSNYLLDNHSYSLEQLTSRTNVQDLAHFVKNGNISFEVSPDKWIYGNAIFSYLDHPLYRRLLSFNLNERGMFPKVWTLESQKNYWNSSLNGGLPITKKREEIHEGTFLLHDMFHFVFQDPIITARETPEEQKAYVAYRMMSEAWTLILADMLSINISGLERTGYDVSARKVYPLFKSMHINPKRLEDLRALLYANSVYCLLGDDSEFRKLGAEGTVLEDYKSKYGTFFGVDAEWNSRNINNIIRIARQNPKLHEYTDCLPDDIRKFDTKDLYGKIVTSDGRISIERLFDVFWNQFMDMTQYEKTVNHIEYAKKGIRKYLSGQIHLAFQFPVSNMKDLVNGFGVVSGIIDDSSNLDEILDTYEDYIGKINNAIDVLVDQQILLPHQRIVHRLGVPHFPPIFLSYDRPKDSYPPLDVITSQIFSGSLVRDGSKGNREVLSAKFKESFLQITDK